MTQEELIQFLQENLTIEVYHPKYDVGHYDIWMEPDEHNITVVVKAHLKAMRLFNKLKISRQYKKLVASIEKIKIFDGRGKGVDVYTCTMCNRKTLTRYKDKGVTPFVIRCPYCDGYANHNDTISEQRAKELCAFENTKVENWVRPPLWWLFKHKEAVEHVLNGGLVLEKEVWYETSHIYD